MQYEFDLSLKARPQITVLSEHQRNKLHRSVLDVLENTGVQVFNDEARKLLEQAGATTFPDDLVKIPSHLVNQALQTSPSRVLIYDRKGNRKMKLEGYNTYFGTGSDLPNSIDPFTRKRRKTLKKDVGLAALLSDYLENIDFVMSMGIASDINSKLADLHHFVEMVSNTIKPIIFTASDLNNLKHVYHMASEIVGGEKELRQRPFIIHYSEPSTPLRHSSEALEKLLFCSEKEIPLIYVSGPAMGASSPVTVAGAVVLSMAEFLSGLVISQLKNSGSPVICGGGSSPLDMKTSNYSYATPENWLNELAIKEMSSFYGLPIFGEGGVSDAKTFDQQAAFENAITLILVGLGGTNLIHDIGYVESGFTASYEGILFGNEIIGALKRFLRGVNTSDNSMAVDVIDRVGPGGNFLTETHTIENFKQEIWEPDYINRQNFEGWEKNGGKPLGEILNKNVRRILKDHEPEKLEQKKIEALKKIITEAKSINETKKS